MSVSICLRKRCNGNKANITLEKGAFCDKIDTASKQNGYYTYSTALTMAFSSTTTPQTMQMEAPEASWGCSISCEPQFGHISSGWRDTCAAAEAPAAGVENVEPPGVVDAVDGSAVVDAAITFAGILRSSSSPDESPSSPPPAAPPSPRRGDNTSS
jgi:hypothetical protein